MSCKQLSKTSVDILCSFRWNRECFNPLGEIICCGKNELVATGCFLEWAHKIYYNQLEWAKNLEFKELLQTELIRRKYTNGYASWTRNFP
ncbi:hypothetical protein DPMN_136615 [Dreissena polymorpha]|uniref:Uncharacterized protein n=1 Tax=Dreissena polymorpha TaxID=45954 RepID=A0A9D4G672_DREPO|nr:hypothetical protein DPMN_136615 [Dreissena polymorpha]